MPKARPFPRIATILLATTKRGTLAITVERRKFFGRQGTVKNDSAPNATCWRCDLPGHIKFNVKKKLAFTSTPCFSCKASIGASYCCEKSSNIFPSAGRFDRAAKRRNTAKGRKPEAGCGKSSSSFSRPNHTPNSKLTPFDTPCEAVKDVPKDVITAMVGDLEEVPESRPEPKEKSCLFGGELFSQVTGGDCA